MMMIRVPWAILAKLILVSTNRPQVRGRGHGYLERLAHESGWSRP